MIDQVKEAARNGEELGYAIAIIDIRDILIEAMKDGRVTIGIHELDDRINQMHEIRKVSGMNIVKD